MTPISDSVDHCHTLARHVAGTRYKDLPPGVVEAAKKSILDTVGVILVASGTEPAVRSVAELVRETGGRSECSVLGFGSRGVAAGLEPLVRGRRVFGHCGRRTCTA